ncbi:hypothetical protein [Pseudoalteromonas sp. JB197]|uniref:hypothetical protein n=1 Tax=Pseudoalteromonas sp. JB197 TaxID=1434839 RepID=UPI00097F0ACB|nr:hypothetical protein [Pseudoalteromonas sp. JB197]PCC12900.1 hypothetical protein CIK86_06195 [Pseudoalteromonas sp. JB197]SJN25542.1 hypothetical protein CZ797_04290 [Pseudoalteromonas sp. JB197]
MPRITLKAGEEQQRPMGARWLSIVEANTRFKIEGGFGSLVGEVGRIFDMEGFNQVTFKNESTEQIEFEYETSNIKVYAVGKGVVSVSNAIEVTRIRESIQVDANATVENGKMAILPANNFESIAPNKTVVAPGQTLEIFPARNAENRSVLIQLITDSPNFSAVRVGTSAANVATGVFMSGNKNAPASFNFENIAAPIFVKNESAENVTLAGGEQWRV